MTAGSKNTWNKLLTICLKNLLKIYNFLIEIITRINYKASICQPILKNKVKKKAFIRNLHTLKEQCPLHCLSILQPFANNIELTYLRKSLIKR